MYIESIGRQMAVCSFDGAIRLTSFDKGYWNVISINGPQEPKALLPMAKTVHYSCFDDVEEENSVLGLSARAEHIIAIFKFIRRLSDSSVPLLIHCQQGISRSTAVALSWIYGQLPPSDDRALKAIDHILGLRPQAKPNRLVLVLGLAQFVELENARRLADWILCEPRLDRNRVNFQNSQKK